MASTETKVLDDIISSRRAMILGGTALAGLLLTKQAKAASTVTTYTDADILNFALNLEYLEANFYYLAAFGTTIDVANNASMTAGAQQITLPAGSGQVMAKANAQVPFTTLQVSSYAVETAIEEGKHVSLLQSALGTMAVAQPALDLRGGAAFDGTAAFNTLAGAANVAGGVFDPFSSDAFFLIGAYIFEDVGVSAYHGAAPLLSTATQPSANLATAAGILAVEAYHAGLVRTSLNAMDPDGSAGLVGITNNISTLRSKLSLAANGGMNAEGTATPDDLGLGMQTISLEGATPVPATTIVDADFSVIAFARSTTQVLNIVTGGGATTAGTKATGVFFPSGLNGLFS